MSFVKARKTIFQPMKTELFKIQVESLTEIFENYVGKNENGLRELFAIDQIFIANTDNMYNEYSNSFFGEKFIQIVLPAG